jgi:hypothetical protein
MATTTRVKKKKVVKKVSKKVVKKISKVLGTLEADDLIKLETFSKDVLIAKMGMNLEEQSLRNMILENELLKTKIISQRELVKGKADRFEVYKNKYVEYKKSINPKYGLSENEPMGYNPDTGEIIKD